MTGNLLRRLSIAGALILVWVLSVFALLIGIGQNPPLLVVPPEPPVILPYGPRVGAGWNVRVWFIVATSLWAVILTVAGGALDAELRKRAARRRARPS